MMQKKQIGLSILIGACLMLSSGRAEAFFAFDAPRTAQFAGQGIMRLLSLISEYQKVHTKEEELKLWEGARQIKQTPTADAYNYLKSADVMKMPSAELLPGQSDTKVADKVIREKFFILADSPNYSDTKVREIDALRHTYLEALAKETLSLSEGLRSRIATEQTALKESQTTAGGQIQQIDLMVQTKKAMAEQKAADLILQAKLMELEAAELMFNLDVVEIKDPSKTEQKTPQKTK